MSQRVRSPRVTARIGPVRRGRAARWTVIGHGTPTAGPGGGQQAAHTVFAPAPGRSGGGRGLNFPSPGPGGRRESDHQCASDCGQDSGRSDRRGGDGHSNRGRGPRDRAGGPAGSPIGDRVTSPSPGTPPGPRPPTRDGPVGVRAISDWHTVL
eukprot:53871-Hanusia_phi.AAC.1